MQNILHYFLKNTLKGFGDFVFGYVYLRKCAVGFSMLISGRENKPSLYAYCILAFHSHPTPLQLCSSVWTKSHMDTHASGIKDWRK